MRSRVTKWFETKVSFEKIMDDGQQKKVSELYVVDALSFTEAEQRITEEMSSYISGAYGLQHTVRFSSATHRRTTGGSGPGCSS